MKINDKNLVYFASSNTPIDKEGWLLKRGEVNKSFQKRWFILKGNLLFYFEKKSDKEPVGVIILEGCTIELAENEDQYTFKIVFHGAGDRTYILGADTQESMEAWMKALACASYDYMKVMVAELQRQLDELTSTNASSSYPTPPPRQHRGRPPRSNPFDRYMSHEESSSASTSKSQNGSSRVVRSVPTTPVPRRPAPPPPKGQLAATASNSSLGNTPKAETPGLNARGSSSGCLDIAVNQSPVVTPVLPRKTFHELHEEFGQRILKQLRNWKVQQKSTLDDNPMDIDK